jgi:hypothetical protein
MSLFPEENILTQEIGSWRGFVPLLFLHPLPLSLLGKMVTTHHNIWLVATGKTFSNLSIIILFVILSPLFTGLLVILSIPRKASYKFTFDRRIIYTVLVFVEILHLSPTSKWSHSTRLLGIFRSN